MLSPARLKNPVMTASFNLRDPGILPVEGGYRVFFSRHDGPWGEASSWSIGHRFTPDFLHFEDDRDVSPKGHASPGDPVLWKGRYVMPYQVYPGYARLVFSESADGASWSPPRVFLEGVLKLPWNEFERAIDPILVPDGDTLHCYFAGSRACRTRQGHANMIGHAVTRDADLSRWDILTVETPMMGWDTIEAGGVENIAIFRAGGEWLMAASESLGNQHICMLRSRDLSSWERLGIIPLPEPRAAWLSKTEGAPTVWREGSLFWMLFMGTDEAGHTTFGLMHSPEGLHWTALPPA